MVISHLLDTNVISEPTKLVPNAKVLARLKRFEGHVAICSLTWHELEYGVERMPLGRKRDHLRAYFDVVRATLPILPYDDRAAAWHALARVRLKKATPPFVDGQIAAIAATNDLTLVTADRDFLPFGVKVDDWTR